MALVTLIQKANSTDRDAIITVDDWNLPKGAKPTGKKDEAGRAIFTMVPAVEPAVILPVRVPVANVVVANTQTLLTEVEEEAKKLINKVENFIHGHKE